jgi:hypothetical protein
MVWHCFMGAQLPRNLQALFDLPIEPTCLRRVTLLGKESETGD